LKLRDEREQETTKNEKEVSTRKREDDMHTGDRNKGFFAIELRNIAQKPKVSASVAHLIGFKQID